MARASLLPGSPPPSRKKKDVTISLSKLATRTKATKMLRPRVILSILITSIILTGYLFLPPIYVDRAGEYSTIVPLGSSHSDRNRLVMVAGHAIWKGGPTLGEVDEEWTLETYQEGHNESLTWIEHIYEGVELASDTESVLIFSGGETRPSSGPRTEAQSYWSLAEARGLLTPDIFQVTTTEIYARDSLENLLFSICRFKEYIGHYPEFVTVIGYEFKRKRFSELHRAAIRFPEEKFTYIGIDPRNDTLVEQLAKLEFSNSLVPFTRDPYACFDEILVEKKASRSWSQRGSGGYEFSCPELRPLFEYCGLHPDGDVRLFEETLPWT